MEIVRKLYLQKIIARQHNGMIKVITGIRRCGKSYLLFNLYKNYLLKTGVKLDHIIELNLDDIRNKQYRDPDELYSYVKSKIVDDYMYYILLDEVQFVPGFEEVLNGFLHIKNCDVYVTGSNAKFLSKDIITEFRGRGDQIHVYPLSFAEFFTTYDTTVITREKALQEYMFYGGLPQLVNMSTHEQKASYLTNLFNETYIVDILNRNKITNELELNELVNILSSSIGSLTNPRKLSNSFNSIKKCKLSVPTISKYLDYLQDSFLIEKANRFDVKGKKYIETPSKYYFTDLGLRNARINFRQAESSHLLENVIYNQLKILGYSVDVGIVNVNEININKNSVKKQLEIDFVCNKADKRIYIQSALSLPDEEKFNKESRPLKKIDDFFTRVIITLDPIITHYNEDGILLMNIFDFLLNEKF